MGSLELLSYFWSLNTILVVKIANFDFGGLSPPPYMGGKLPFTHGKIDVADKKYKSDF